MIRRKYLSSVFPTLNWQSSGSAPSNSAAVDPATVAAPARPAAEFVRRSRSVTAAEERRRGRDALASWRTLRNLRQASGACTWQESGLSDLGEPNAGELDDEGYPKLKRQTANFNITHNVNRKREKEEREWEVRLWQKRKNCKHSGWKSNLETSTNAAGMNWNCLHYQHAPKNQTNWSCLISLT